MKNTYFKLFLIITPTLVSSFYPEALSMPVLIFLFLQHTLHCGALTHLLNLQLRLLLFLQLVWLFQQIFYLAVFVSKIWFDFCVVSFMSSSNICCCIDLSFFCFFSASLSLYGFCISALLNSKNWSFYSRFHSWQVEYHSITCDI